MCVSNKHVRRLGNSVLIWIVYHMNTSYSAKFLRCLIFAIFTNSFQTAKIKLRETSIPCLVWWCKWAWPAGIFDSQKFISMKICKWPIHENFVPQKFGAIRYVQINLKYVDIFRISINDSTIPSVCYTVIYMVTEW